MTQTKLFALSAVLATASLAACGAAPAAGPATAAQATGQSEPSAETAPQSRAFTGTVAETINSGGYTYVRLQAGKDEVWIAASEFAVKSGERLSVALETPMQDFHSPTLNRDFPLIYFVADVAREGEALSAQGGQAAAPTMMGSHQPAAAAQPVEPIPPAPGGTSIADLWAKRKSLAGKQVIVRGKVAKVNNGIMGSNWLHVQDGSGSAADGTNDLTITTAGEAQIGDIVTASGVLAIEKDFGAGYSYEAILENATLTAK